MDVEIQPGPSNMIHRFITSNNLYATNPHNSAFSIAVGNFNFPAKSSLNYSRQHLLDFGSHFPLSRSLTLSLKNRRLTETCCVHAGTIIKYDSGCIPNNSATRVIYDSPSLHKLAYYGHVNNRNISYTNTASLLSVNFRPFDYRSGTQLHRHTKYRRRRGGRLVKLRESLRRKYIHSVVSLCRSSKKSCNLHRGVNKKNLIHYSFPQGKSQARDRQQTGV